MYCEVCEKCKRLVVFPDYANRSIFFIDCPTCGEHVATTLQFNLKLAGQEDYDWANKKLAELGR